MSDPISKPHISPFSRVELPERFNYLFENMEAEMQPIFETDRVLTYLLSKLQQYDRSTKESFAREDEALRLQAEAQAVIDELSAKLRDAQRDYNIATGRISSEHSIRLQLKNRTKVAEKRMESRQRDLTLFEARKRLSVIGRAIKKNTGRYRGPRTSNGRYRYRSGETGFRVEEIISPSTRADQQHQHSLGDHGVGVSEPNLPDPGDGEPLCGQSESHEPKKE
jgi:hypothetical protein